MRRKQQRLYRNTGACYEDVLEDVKENVALKRIKSKVDNETAAEIRELNLPGVMIDEDVERTYPYYTLAASRNRICRKR